MIFGADSLAADPVPGPWRTGYVFATPAAPTAMTVPAKPPAALAIKPKPAAAKPPAPAAPAKKPVWPLVVGALLLAGAAVVFFTAKKRRAKSRPTRDNPAAASEFYEKFHWGRRPSRTKRVKVPEAPETLTELGRLEAITYSTKKGDDGIADYVHDFGGKKPVLAVDPENGRLHIVGGSYTVEDRGIVG